MPLGTIEGKTTTNAFTFLAEQEPRSMDYVAVTHKSYGEVLCQIVGITKGEGKTHATCAIIGYREKDRIKRPRMPFEPGSTVEVASDELIAKVLNLAIPDKEDSPLALIGNLDGRTLPVTINLNTILTRHLAVLAKSGAGKSYTVAVILEEILERGVPLIIIDPHGEYASMANPNTEAEEVANLALLYKLAPKSYPINVYGDSTTLPGIKPLRLSNNLSRQELVHLFPSKLTASQEAILYSALRNLKEFTFEKLIAEIDLDESPAKFHVINTLDYLRTLPFFAPPATPYNDLVKRGQATVINLKGVAPEIQEMLVYKLCKDLFQLRKQDRVSPFFLVVEEAHNYCPERSFGETKSSKVLRDIASEGRKFGLGMCIVSQRPARVDKSVLSQCNTQVILKITNPNDLKAVSNSVEGMTSEAEQEIRGLAIGTALLTGATELPLFVTIRPRRTNHGGRAIDVLASSKQGPLAAPPLEAVLAEPEPTPPQAPLPESMMANVERFEEQEILPLIKTGEAPPGATTILIPAYEIVCKEGQNVYKLLVERQHGAIVTDPKTLTLRHLPALDQLLPQEVLILQHVFTKGKAKSKDIATALGIINPEEQLQSLAAIGYLSLEGEEASISDAYIFTRLSKAASTTQISYESLPDAQRREASMGIDEIKDQLRKFTTIQDHHDCFIITYALPKPSKKKASKASEDGEETVRRKKPEKKLAKKTRTPATQAPTEATT